MKTKIFSIDGVQELSKSDLMTINGGSEFSDWFCEKVGEFLAYNLHYTINCSKMGVMTVL